jgi:hypothetical protein
MEEMSIIYENDAILNAIGYFTVYHELELIDINVYEHSTLLLFSEIYANFQLAIFLGYYYYG